MSIEQRFCSECGIREKSKYIIINKSRMYFRGLPDLGTNIGELEVHVVSFASSPLYSSMCLDCYETLTKKQSSKVRNTPLNLDF